MMKSSRSAYCWPAVLIACAVASATQPVPCGLSQTRVVRDVTRDPEGGGARPEILSLDDCLVFLYRDTIVKGGSFRLTILDQDLRMTTAAKKLVTSDSKGGVTDIRAVTDGHYVYAAYETASSTGHSLYAIKFDSSLREIARRKIASNGLPGKGVEALDDPAPMLAADRLYVITKIGEGPNENQYRVRELALDSLATKKVRELRTGLDLGLANVCSAISANDHFYLVTTVHVSGKPLCPRSDPTTNNDLVVVEYRPDWSPTGFQKVIAKAGDVELYPTGFARAGEFYYVAYQSFDPKLERRECGTKGETTTVTSVRLKVLDGEFNTVAETRVTDDSETALHPTLLVIGSRVLVAYGHRSLPLGGSASGSNVWLRVFELACD